MRNQESSLVKRVVALTCFLTFLAIGFSYCQEPVHYLNCDCDETITYSADSKEILDGPYKLTCNKIEIETGNYTKGLKNGAWITRNKKGLLIKRAEYVDGKINGKYELFHFEGSPKLIAYFSNGVPEGTWEYFNEKGRTLKKGNYRQGKPVGVWSINDKNGKKTIATYDFDKGDVNTIAAPYFKKGGIERDDQSGEYYLIYYPERNPESLIQPFGGFTITCDFFMKFFTIPTVMMDTYTNYNFKITLLVENNVVMNTSIAFVDKFNYKPGIPTFPFIVSTNPPAKLWRMEHNKQSMDLLMDRIIETISIMGPWIGNAKVELYVPFVLNDIKRF